MPKPSAAALFNEGQMHYSGGRIPAAFDLYYRAIKQILDREDVLFKIPSGQPVPVDCPRELLAFIWVNFQACFRLDNSPFTEEAYPDAYALVYSFRPSSSARAHPRFKGPQGRHLLTVLQISAALTLGIAAWTKGERATAAKRYLEGLDLAAAHSPFTSALTPGLRHLDRYAALEVGVLRDNLAMLGANDAANTTVVGGGELRKDVLEVPHVRVGPEGVTVQGTTVVATDACGRKGCDKRGVGFKRCAKCMKIAYCGVECQKEDWKEHKTTHV